MTGILPIVRYGDLADVVYLPRRGDSTPALVVGLKWDRSPEAAVA